MTEDDHSQSDKPRDQDLILVLYSELKKLAAARLARLPGGQTLQATALVHEAYIRLQKESGVEWTSRAHFFGSAARAMRDILVDAARRKSTDKRGGERDREDLPDIPADSIVFHSKITDVLSLNDALAEFAKTHGRKAQVVELKYFAGLNTEEIAALFEVSTRTIDEDWRFAKAWLFKKLKSEP